MRKEQLFRYVRYLALHLPHLTPPKILNIMRVERALLSGRSDLSGTFPYSLFVDLSNTCNLRCPLCLMGQRRVRPRRALMDLDAYQRLIDPLRAHLLQVLLYNNSEPFLNQHLYDIIRYTTQQNIGTVISSNLNLPVEADRLVDSGLTYLIISGDGHTQSLYEQYRVNGDLASVQANVRAVVAAKRKKRARLPYIEWQCLVTKKNQAFLKEIKASAYRLGVNTVRFANLNFYSVPTDDRSIEQAWLPENQDFQAFASPPNIASRPGRRRPCYWLWRTAVVNCDGGVMPCCLFDTNDWGNALKEPFPSIWNNRYYQKARSLTYPDVPSGPPLVCDHCPVPFRH